MTKLLEVKNLTVKYGSDHEVLSQISMDVYEKEIIGIVGESGSGKTTLIRSMNQMLPRNANVVSGEILFDGVDLLKASKKQWSAYHGKQIAMIFQNPKAYFNPILKMDVQFVDTIRIHKRVSKAEAHRFARKALEKMCFEDVDQVMEAYPFQLSGGMIQRVAIAIAYALEPRIILADEPTSALDVINQRQIMDELMLLRDRIHTSIILVTHNIGCAAYAADRIKVMQKGSVVEFDQRCKVLYAPQKEYTKELFQAIPKLKGRHSKKCYKNDRGCIGCQL